jgi:tetratricopeptide (TPR) repeat protein
MEALMQKKIAEASQHITDAEKSMKTSLFKRKPDLDSAGNSYAQASTCFKVAKDLTKAITYSQKSAECYTQNDSFHNAAKQYEQIGLMANENKNYKLVLDSFEKATELLITNGTRDSAGILLERGAGMLKATYPEGALKLYKRALQVADVEGKSHEMVSLYENSLMIAMRLEQHQEAIELINESLPVLDEVGTQEQITKYILTACIMHLNREDWVAAKNFLDTMKKKYDVGAESRGFGRVDDLLEAYEQYDDEKFKGLIKNYLSYAVDNEALKIANKIVKSDDWLKHAEESKTSTKQPSYNQNAQSSSTSSSANKPSDDFEEDDLC